ncbi:LicD family protein [Methanobrevibacter sp. UBA188]|uniref:LicD family protein n=1 Tax=Methanobrevibacter sp. UBA188 TaxID=1915473 RepID=UPI0025DDFAD5|nr:LicD family protein [Methanobrevibacter sp. UBA188]
MNLGKLYEKSPKIIQKSEKILLYSMRLSKFIYRKKTSPSQPNEMLNFLIKSTNIRTEGTLRDIQLLYTELLRFIDNVCNKYNLEYCLAYGTLIGAVRHEGFIPWDDDFDIIMMRTDYNKLIEVLPKEINKYDYFKENCALTRLINANDNYFKDFNTIYDEKLGHDKYFSSDPKLGKSTFLQLGWLKPMVKLDIFPFDYVKEDSIDYYTKNYLGHKYYFNKLYHDPDFSFEKEFNERFEKLGLTLDETDFIAEGIDASSADDLGVFEKNIFFPTKTMKFEGYDIKCPNKPDKFIERLYGNDFMNIPENIRIHGYSEYNSTLFNSKEEMDKSFKHVINYLKEINDNYYKYSE